jgi:cell division protein FtsZ
MVRPGMINLDFADVETVMSSMGKAMMGTGEAEGENRAMAATEMALNNPLIDEYSLQGARGLLINITGGKDLTLFEVDQAVNKIRAEVDPEAELIFGAIKDENMTGKIRVSIVATALDGHKSENKTVLNMVSRIQNRNTGYSDSLFSHNTRADNSNTLNSIEGATALKLDESYEINEEPNASINFESNLDNQHLESAHSNEDTLNDITSGVSMENAAYMENNINDVKEKINNSPSSSDDIIEEYTPKLFSEEQSFQDKTELENDDQIENETEHLFDQDTNEEEDFEIPAFLRKQKF